MAAARPIVHHPPTGISVRQAAVGHHTESVLQPPLSAPTSMMLSTSCPQHLDSRSLESSLDSLQLTASEIDAIRNIGRADRGSGASSPSTPTSQLSHPDFDDSRPDIYRFVYDVSPGSRSRTSDNASASAEGGDSRPLEFPPDSKFDDIIISSMEHARNRRRRNVKTVQEVEGACESSQKHTVEHAQSQSLPTAAESAASVQAAASEPETHVPVTSFPATIPSNEVVVSIGDALVTVEQSCELLAPEDVHHEAQQPPATTAAAVPTAGPSRLLERASSRFHKGRCMFRSTIYLMLLSMFQLYSIQNVIHILWHARAVWQLASLIVSAVAVLSLIIHQCSD